MTPPISRTLTCTFALTIALSLGAATAHAQQDALVIEKDAVKVTTSLAVTGRATAETFSGSFEGKGAVPVGAILMWSGSPDQLPAGWVLCDGRTLPDGGKAPDLSGRFIVGYQKSNPAEYDVNKTGGEARHTLSVEEIPAHNHGESGQHNHSLWASGHGWAFAVVQTGDTRHTDDSHTVYTSNNGAHTHATVGGGKPHENRPPYYALAYIMYTGK